MRGSNHTRPKIFPITSAIIAGNRGKRVGEYVEVGGTSVVVVMVMVMVMIMMVTMVVVVVVAVAVMMVSKDKDGDTVYHETENCDDNCLVEGDLHGTE